MVAETFGTANVAHHLDELGNTVKVAKFNLQDGENIERRKFSGLLRCGDVNIFSYNALNLKNASKIRSLTRDVDEVAGAAGKGIKAARSAERRKAETELSHFGFNLHE